MKYDRQLAVDFGSQVVSQIFAVASVLLGAGVWGLAAGQVLKASSPPSLTAALSIGFNGRRSAAGARTGRWCASDSASRRASTRSWHVSRGSTSWSASSAASPRSESGRSRTGSSSLPLVAFNSLYVVGFPAMSNLLARGEDRGSRSSCERSGAPPWPAASSSRVFAASAPESGPGRLRRAVARRRGHRSVHLPLDADPRLDRRRGDELPVGCRPAGHRRLGVGGARRRLDRGYGGAPAVHRRHRDRRREPRRRARRGRDPRRAPRSAWHVAPYRPLMRAAGRRLLGGRSRLAHVHTRPGRPVDCRRGAVALTLALNTMGLLLHVAMRRSGLRLHDRRRPALRSGRWSSVVPLTDVKRPARGAA